MVVLTVRVGQRHHLRYLSAYYFRSADLGVTLGDLQTLVYFVAISSPSRRAGKLVFEIRPSYSAVFASKQTPPAPGDSTLVREVMVERIGLWHQRQCHRRFLL